MEELLKPSQFVWADESEELEGEEEIEGQGERSISEGELKEMMASFYDLERQPSNSSDEPVDEEGEWSDFDEVMFSEATTPEPDYEELKRASIQEDVNQEFAFRQGWMEAAGESIHHFNWLGTPRYEYSSTPPTISLLFLFTAPKIPKQGDEWRLDAIMRTAMRHVDPVVLHPENGPEDFRLRGSELVRWAKGRAFKFYSPHGNWKTDRDDIADGTIMDTGNIDMYMGSPLHFGNGYVRDYTIRSRAQWGVEHQRLYAEKFLAPSQTRSPKTPYKPSHLRHCVSSDDLEDLDGKLTTSTLGDISVSGANEKYNIGAEPSIAPRIQRPASLIPRIRRAFSQSAPDLLAGLQRETSVHGFESALDFMTEDGSEGSEYTDDSENTNNNYDSDDSDDEHLDIGEIVQLSYEEFKEAERRRKYIIERAALEPTLETIHEEDEPALDSEEDEKVNTVDNVEQVQDDQNNDFVEQNRDTNDLVIEQAKNGQNDQNDQIHGFLQSSHLGGRNRHDQELDMIDTVKQDEDDQKNQLGQNGHIELDFETVQQNKNDQNYTGHIDQLESTDPRDHNKKVHQRVSSGTHATSRQSGSETTFEISNEQQNQDTNLQAVDSEPQSSVTDQKNKRWKERISCISQKAHNALRSKHAQSSKSDSSGSFESTLSPTSNCDPDRQHISLFHTEIPQDGNEELLKTCSTNKFAKKVKRVLSISSTEKDTVMPKKQRRISFSDLFYGGIRAFESYSVMA